VPNAKSKREHISPSDLTFLFRECERCFWIKYNLGVVRPMFMPLVGPMATMQERTFHGKTASELGMDRRGGFVSSWGKIITSSKILIEGESTRWSLKGKYDIAVTFPQGDLAIVDCKITTGEMDEQKMVLYKPQLEAYAYAFEHPEKGVATSVIETGLLMWKIANAFTGLQSFGPIFQAKPSYLRMDRDPDYFTMFITRVIEVLEGDIPDADKSCTYCSYLEKREDAIAQLILSA
jgi:PD-(D/E)XK nuclease superfamily